MPFGRRPRWLAKPRPRANRPARSALPRAGPRCREFPREPGPRWRATRPRQPRRHRAAAARRATRCHDRRSANGQATEMKQSLPPGRECSRRAMPCARATFGPLLGSSRAQGHANVARLQVSRLPNFRPQASSALLPTSMQMAASLPCVQRGKSGDFPARDRGRARSHFNCNEAREAGRSSGRGRAGRPARPRRHRGARRPRW